MDHVYDPNKLYNDHQAPFLRMNKELVESMFGISGPYSQSETTPNWLVKHELGYELVRVDDEGVVLHNTGIFIDVQPRSLDGLQWETGKGKAVAYWNYRVHAPGDDYTVRMFSDCKYHYIIAYADGYVAVANPRSGPKHSAQSVLLTETKDGRFPFMPFVYLAFFMWLEEEDNATFKWLIGNAPGWSAAYGV